MRTQRTETFEEGSRLRYLHFRRNRLNVAIRLLEEVLELSRKQPAEVAVLRRNTTSAA